MIGSRRLQRVGDPRLGQVPSRCPRQLPQQCCAACNVTLRLDDQWEPWLTPRVRLDVAYLVQYKRAKEGAGVKTPLLAEPAVLPVFPDDPALVSPR